MTRVLLTFIVVALLVVVCLFIVVLAIFQVVLSVLVDFNIKSLKYLFFRGCDS